MLLQQIVSGLINGSGYALVAAGIVMIYKATNTVNFAQGEFFMLGAYAAFFLHVALGLNYVVAFVLSAIAVGVLGCIFERIAFRPLIKSPHISTIIAAVGLSFVIKGTIRLIMTGSPMEREVPFPPAMSNKPMDIFGLIITPQQVIIVIISLIIAIALGVFFKFTKLGKSMRAVCSNQSASSLMGISVSKVFSITWGLSSFLGAAAGVLIAPVILVYPDMGAILMKAFAAGAVGGFSSLTGSIVGGYLIGVIENMAGGYLTTEFTGVTAFWILITVLIFKPRGLFGKKVIQKV